MTHVTAGWLPRTGISSGTLRSAIKCGLPLPFVVRFDTKYQMYLVNAFGFVAWRLRGNCSVICCVWQLYKMICTQMWAVLKFICQSDLNFVVCLVLVMHLMCITVIVICVFMSFSALTLLVGQQAEHPACKNWVMRCWCGYLSGADCLHMVQLMPLPSRNPIIPCLI